MSSFSALAGAQETGCPSTVAILAPLNGCKSGTATVAVAPVTGATYTWTVDGATVLDGAGTEILTLALGTTSTASVSVDVATPGCVSHGTAAIALHEPFSVHASAIDGRANEPLTINWTYTNGTPVSQILTGSDFGPVTLGPLDRSYTYTPTTSGGKQATIDAVLQGTATTPAPSSRRRAVAKTIVTASACTTAHATTHYDVATAVCPAFTSQLYAPGTVVTGTSFSLAVSPAQSGLTATWTIVNGTPSSTTGISINVAAGKVGPLSIKVRLEQGACSTELTRTIDVIEKPVCNNPTAKVTLVSTACNSAVLNVTFTGLAPFHGTWSDGTEFTSLASTMFRTVVVGGTYGIQSFNDAACAGTPIASAVVPALHPTATIIGKATSCVGEDTYQIHLTGKAPFHLSFLDGTSLVTSETDITRPVSVAGANSVNGTDADSCAIATLGGITGRLRPTVSVTRWCAWDSGYSYPIVVMAQVSGTPPMSVTWTNGATTPTINVNPTTPQTFTVASARDAYCSAFIDPSKATITVYPDPPPDFNVSGAGLCAGVPHPVSLSTPPPAGATILWSIDYGSIVSGQGTSSMQYKALYSTATISCTFSYAGTEHCPKTTKRTVQLIAAATGTITLPQTVIQVNHSLQFRIFASPASSSPSSWSIENSLGDTITTPPQCNITAGCDAVYNASHGPGTSTITFHFIDGCGVPKTTTAQLTIIP